MGFVIQVAHGKAEVSPGTGVVPGLASNAARGRLGAKTAIRGFLNMA